MASSSGQERRHESKHLASTATLTAATLISGCAVDPAIEQRATVFAVGGPAVAPEEVRIFNQTAASESAVAVQRRHATTPGGEYDCSAVQGTQLVAQPVCVKKQAVARQPDFDVLASLGLASTVDPEIAVCLPRIAEKTKWPQRLRWCDEFLRIRQRTGELEQLARSARSAIQYRRLL